MRMGLTHLLPLMTTESPSWTIEVWMLVASDEATGRQRQEHTPTDQSDSPHDVMVGVEWYDPMLLTALLGHGERAPDLPLEERGEPLGLLRRGRVLGEQFCRAGGGRE